MIIYYTIDNTWTWFPNRFNISESVKAYMKRLKVEMSQKLSSNGRNMAHGTHHLDSTLLVLDN